MIGVFYCSPKMGKHGQPAESGHFWLLKSMVQYQWVHHTTQCMRCQLSFLTLTPNIMNISVSPPQKNLVTHGPIKGVWWNSRAKNISDFHQHEDISQPHHTFTRIIRTWRGWTSLKCHKLVVGFNPLEKYESTWTYSPSRVENSKNIWVATT